MLCATFLSSSAIADITLNGIGVTEAGAVKKFDGMRQHGVFLSYRVRSDSNRLWVPSSLELASGWIERGGDRSNFVSLGPSYRMHFRGSDFGRWFADFGSQPTYISKSNFGGKPLGGKFFFTTYMGAGAYLDSRRRTCFLLRYQHTSNAGLDGDNPGVDMVGLTISYHFGETHRLLSAENTSE